MICSPIDYLHFKNGGGGGAIDARGTVLDTGHRKEIDRICVRVIGQVGGYRLLAVLQHAIREVQASNIGDRIWTDAGTVSLRSDNILHGVELVLRLGA